jgi:hypothetical protein
MNPRRDSNLPHNWAIHLPNPAIIDYGIEFG